MHPGRRAALHGGLAALAGIVPRTAISIEVAIMDMQGVVMDISVEDGILDERDVCNFIITVVWVLDGALSQSLPQSSVGLFVVVDYHLQLAWADG